VASATLEHPIKQSLRVPSATTNPDGFGTDLHAASSLVIDAVGGVTDIVEDLHRTISTLAPVVGAPRGGRTRGITGLVYRSVRGITRAVGVSLDAALGRLAPLLDRQVMPPPARASALAALNGVLGDFLEANGNALALPMQWRQAGVTVDARALLRAPMASPSRRVLVLIHGLCMHDGQWQREGHDHGAALAAALGLVPLYLRYNSGRSVAVNGRELAAQLETVLGDLAIDIDELILLGHSMGGLVARSALHYGDLAQHRWRQVPTRLLCLGSPHLGAPLERAGHGLDLLLGVSPYSAPFARLGLIRSAGIQDLRHGRVIDADGSDATLAPPLPRGISTYLVAASKQKTAPAKGRPRGDGLVPVDSALGRHRDPQRALGVPDDRCRLVFAHDHFDLLASREVYAQLLDWLQNDHKTQSRRPGEGRGPS